MGRESRRSNDFIYNSLLRHQGQEFADAWQERKDNASASHLFFDDIAPNSHVNTFTIAPLNDVQVAAKVAEVAANLKPNPQTARAVTERLTSCTEGELSRTAYRVYQALHEVAVRVAESRGYHARVSRVSFFCPMEIVAYALDMHRSTLWRNLRELLELGYIDARVHYTTLYGRTVIDGTVWQVKMNPLQGKSARLGYDELKARYRDLSRDVQKSETVHQYIKNSKMQQSEMPKGDKDVINTILDWTFNPLTNKNPVKPDCCISRTNALECVLDVPHADRDARNDMVGDAADAIAHATGDQGSVSFYRQFLWDLLRRFDQGIDNGEAFRKLYNEVLRVSVDKSEGFARKAGALLVSRLKRWAEYDDIRRTTKTRVGTTPIAA